MERIQNMVWKEDACFGRTVKRAGGYIKHRTTSAGEKPGVQRKKGRVSTATEGEMNCKDE